MSIFSRATQNKGVLGHLRGTTRKSKTDRQIEQFKRTGRL